MAVLQNPTEAQSNQVPPELRRYVSTRCDGLSEFKRYNNDNETHNRGWVIVARSLYPSKLPDEYEVRKVSVCGDGLRALVREQ
jgi:hypothetical protein